MRSSACVYVFIINVHNWVVIVVKQYDSFSVLSQQPNSEYTKVNALLIFMLHYC